MGPLFDDMEHPIETSLDEISLDSLIELPADVAMDDPADVLMDDSPDVLHSVRIYS